jgi:hypothetical protein
MIMFANDDACVLLMHARKKPRARRYDTSGGGGGPRGREAERQGRRVQQPGHPR